MKTFSFLLILLMSHLSLVACADRFEKKPFEYFIEGYPIGKLLVGIERPWVQDFIDIYNENKNENEEQILSKSVHHLSAVHLRNSGFFSFFNSLEKIEKVQFSESVYNRFNDVKESQNLNISLSSGTGFVINRNNKSYIITNFHVVCCASHISSISFELQSKNHPLLKLHVKRIVELNPLSDVAIIELKDRVLFKNSYRLVKDTSIIEARRQPVEVRGFPNGVETLINGKLRYIPQADLVYEKDVCISDPTALEVYQGSSGSPLFIDPVINVDGSIRKEVIGLVHGYVIHKESQAVTMRATPSQVVFEIFERALEENKRCEIKDCFNQALRYLYNEFKKIDNKIAKMRLNASCKDENGKEICPKEFYIRNGNGEVAHSCDDST